jgi:hypothetical protein
VWGPINDIGGIIMSVKLTPATIIRTGARSSIRIPRTMKVLHFNESQTWVGEGGRESQNRRIEFNDECFLWGKVTGATVLTTSIRLPKGSMIRYAEYGDMNIIPTSDVTINTVPYKSRKLIEVNSDGTIYKGTVAHNFMFHGIPLKGNSEFTYLEGFYSSLLGRKFLFHSIPLKKNTEVEIGKDFTFRGFTMSRDGIITYENKRYKVQEDEKVRLTKKGKLKIVHLDTALDANNMRKRIILNKKA